MRLLLRLKLVKTYGSDLDSAEANTVGCVNNLLHSMFSSLSVSLNGKPVTLRDSNYHYKVYLEKLLNYVSDASGTHPLSSFWFLDSLTCDGALKDNTGYATRLYYLSNNKTIELYRRLHADLFNSDKKLINGVDMNIKLTRTPEAFYLLAPLDDTKLRIKILDATLFILQVQLKPPLLLAHANVLGMKLKAHYPVTLLRSRHLLRVLGPSRSLSIMHSSAQFQKEFSLHWLKTLHSLVLPVQIHYICIII